MVVKLTTALVLGFFGNHDFEPEQAAMVVEKMADYLSMNNA